MIIDLEYYFSREVCNKYEPIISGKTSTPSKGSFSKASWNELFTKNQLVGSNYSCCNTVTSRIIIGQCCCSDS